MQKSCLYLCGSCTPKPFYWQRCHLCEVRQWHALSFQFRLVPAFVCTYKSWLLLSCENDSDSKVVIITSHNSDYLCRAFLFLSGWEERAHRININSSLCLWDSSSGTKSSLERSTLVASALSDTIKSPRSLCVLSYICSFGTSCASVSFLRQSLNRIGAAPAAGWGTTITKLILKSENWIFSGDLNPIFH